MHGYLKEHKADLKPPSKLEGVQYYSGNMCFVFKLYSEKRENENKTGLKFSNERNTIQEHLLFKDLQLIHSGKKAKNTMC